MKGLAIDRLALWEAPLIVDDSRPAIPADYPDRLAGLVAADRRGDAIELFLTFAANASSPPAPRSSEPRPILHRCSRADGCETPPAHFPATFPRPPEARS